MNKMIEIALSQYGEKEITGKQNNKTIVRYAKEAGFDWVNDDETPWCAIFMNWCAMKAGRERTHTALARDWLKIGESTNSPELGDVVVLARGNSAWQGHVGLFVRRKGNTIYILGGNQSNTVMISPYTVQSILDYRKLKENA